MLIPNWNVSPSQVEAAPFLYDEGNYLALGNTFNFASELELKNAINNANTHYIQSPPSIYTCEAFLCLII
jgi:hypothetical protein